MKKKAKVILAGLKLPMRTVLMAANKIYADYGKELVITSGLDGIHSAGSMHYYGYALDMRTWYFSAETVGDVARELRQILGDDYLVLLESNHIHVQYKFESIARDIKNGVNY